MNAPYRHVPGFPASAGVVFAVVAPPTLTPFSPFPLESTASPCVPFHVADSISYHALIPGIGVAVGVFVAAPGVGVGVDVRVGVGVFVGADDVLVAVAVGVPPLHGWVAFMAEVTSAPARARG